jgi:[ribosomal protein S18]-alanine N-acetyltransferase
MLVLRYMTVEDIPQVTAIDRVSFNPPWSAKSYTYEVSESTYSHMVVLEETHQTARRSWWQSFRNRWNGHNHTNGEYTDRRGVQHKILGYGGLWHIIDEAHISTIATHPDYRGRGYGEILLAGMMHRSLTLDAAYIVLEVRVSNEVAQRLYHKYRFATVTTKTKYYRSNNEDAYDMRVTFSEAYREFFPQQFQAVQMRTPFLDRYSAVPSPHQAVKR